MARKIEVHEIEKRLSEKRFRHILGVTEVSHQLAERYGEDPERVRTAALLHDVAKEIPREDLERELRRADPEGFRGIQGFPALWHAAMGALVARSEFEIEDPEILSVIRHHPTGHPSFGRLGHILFAADYLEPGQRNPEYETITELAMRDLPAAARAVIRKKADHIFAKQRPLHLDMVLYWNALAEEEGSGETSAQVRT